MRAYPSAAPVATPSNKHNTERMPGIRSSALTKCISEVPGFAKHTSTPLCTKVSTSVSAPVYVLSAAPSGLVLSWFMIELLCTFYLAMGTFTQVHPDSNFQSHLSITSACPTEETIKDPALVQSKRYPICAYDRKPAKIFYHNQQPTAITDNCPIFRQAVSGTPPVAN